MTFLDLLAFKKMTIYRLSQLSGIPKTTLTDLGSGKTSLLDASGKTLLGISKALKVSTEELLELEPEEDGRTLTVIGFKPMDSEIIDKIGRKYHLYV